MLSLTDLGYKGSILVFRHFLEVHQETLSLCPSENDYFVLTDLEGSSALVRNHVLIIDLDLLPLSCSNAPCVSYSDIKHLNVALRWVAVPWEHKNLPVVHANSRGARSRLVQRIDGCPLVLGNVVVLNGIRQLILAEHSTHCENVLVSHECERNAVPGSLEIVDPVLV